MLLFIFPYAQQLAAQAARYCSVQDDGATLCYPPPRALEVGAARLNEYLPSLEGKRVGLVCNQASRVHQRYLWDTLASLGVDLQILFTPEHGLLGQSGAGELVDYGTTHRHKALVVSLYGKRKRPSAEAMAMVDIVLFDLQDVGVRCYTYASTMTYMMEACAQYGKPFVVLDRPNPLGRVVDGPLLTPSYRSFVGLHPIPWQHGMTLGELAQMINGEGWLANGRKCKLTVIACANYSHADIPELPTPPSPNLPNAQAIRLYPTLAFLEGSYLSVGRGTSWPFQVVGHPNYQALPFRFTPDSCPAAKHPPFKGIPCRGYDLRNHTQDTIQIDLPLLIQLFSTYPDKKHFFTPFFDKLAGTKMLREQLTHGASPATIRASWAAPIAAFKAKRTPYLLYRE